MIALCYPKKLAMIYLTFEDSCAVVQSAVKLNFSCRNVNERFCLGITP